MIDVDRFKAYNDTYGHLGGDQALRTVATCLQKTLKRPTDVAARYGGEEFVAILPGTDEDGAFFIADEFRENLRDMSVPHSGSDKGILTASVGVAVLLGGGRMAPEELLRRADEALYSAKEAGRNRVGMAGASRKFGLHPVNRYRRCLIPDCCARSSDRLSAALPLWKAQTVLEGRPRCQSSLSRAPISDWFLTKQSIVERPLLKTILADFEGRPVWSRATGSGSRMKRASSISPHR